MADAWEWTLLPRSNHKQGGAATCMAFAVSLLQNKRLTQCLPLQLCRPTRLLPSITPDAMF